MSRLVRHALLALLLAFAQQAGIVHLTAHATQRLHDTPTTTTDDGTARCAQCVLYASLGASPVPATSVPEFINPRPTQLPAVIEQPSKAQATSAYRSRAPPLPA
jgi:glycine/D-amino acid oxidase-like deaminating enzyme